MRETATGRRRPVRGAGVIAAVLVALVLTVAAGGLVVAAAGCDMPSTGGLGQVTGSGTPVTQTYDLTGFTKVAADSGFTVTVTQGAEYAVSVTVDDNLVEEHLKVELEGDTLRIGLASLWAYSDVTLEATVTMPGLRGLEASGASTVSAAGFASGDSLELEASGASRLVLTGVGAGDTSMDLSGASRIEGELGAQELAGDVSGAGALELQGSAQKLQLDASGGSRFALAGLTVVDADLSVSGGSNGEVTVTGTLDADVSGGSRLEYSGSPQLGSIDASGGSTVQPAGD